MGELHGDEDGDVDEAGEDADGVEHRGLHDEAGRQARGLRGHLSARSRLLHGGAVGGQPAVLGRVAHAEQREGQTRDERDDAPDEVNRVEVDARGGQRGEHGGPDGAADAGEGHAQPDEEAGALHEPAVDERGNGQPQDGDLAQAQHDGGHVEQHDGVREAHQQEGAAHERGRGGQKDADVHGLQQLARKRRGDGHGQVHNGDVHGEGGDLHAQALSHDRLEQAPGGEAQRAAPYRTYPGKDEDCCYCRLYQCR